MNYFDYMEAMATLEQYLRQAGECEELPALSQDRRDAVLALNASVPGVNAILASLAPDSGQISAGSVEDHRRGLLLVEEAHELLEEAHELLTGIEALRLITEMDEEDHDEHGPFGFLKLSDLPLDPAVTQAAQDHWSGAKYRSAVVDAANAVSELVQERLGRAGLSGTVLMEQAFSKDAPQPGCPRLRCPGDQDDRTVKGQQEGAHRFAAGCFLAIRNPAAHGKGDWNPVTAFEWLAALSIVARWGRHWEVVR